MGQGVGGLSKPAGGANEPTLHPFHGGYCELLSGEPPWETRRDRHDETVLLAFAGQGTLWVNGAETPLCKGMMALIHPQEEYRLLPPATEDFRVMRLLVPANGFRQAVAFLGKGLEGALVAQDGGDRRLSLNEAHLAATLQAMQALKRFPKENAEAYLTQLRLTVTQVLARFFEHAQRQKHGDIPAWLASLAREMRKKEHYASGLPAMRAITGYTPEYLCRAFRKHMNTSPTKFLNAIRIEEAALRLVYTGEDIPGIAAEIGYDNLSHFYHLFKQRYGVAPLQYRRQHANPSAAAEEGQGGQAANPPAAAEVGQGATPLAGSGVEPQSPVSQPIAQVSEQPRSGYDANGVGKP